MGTHMDLAQAQSSTLLQPQLTQPCSGELTQPCVDFLFNVFIPSMASLALGGALLLLVGHLIQTAERSCRKTSPRFGRKGFVATAASLLFVMSCFYRSIFVADEGAALCRSASSIFNAPASGRMVATIGEI